MSETQIRTYHPDGTITEPSLSPVPLAKELYDRLWGATLQGKVYEEVWRQAETDVQRTRDCLNAAQMAVASGPVYETLTAEHERSVHMWESTREARLDVATAEDALRQATANLSCHREETANLRSLALLTTAMNQ